VYRFTPLFRDQEKKTLEARPDTFVEGEIGDYLIVSVPETLTTASAKMVRDQAMEAFKRPVMIITHNVEFVRVEKLSTAEATRLLREIDEMTHPKPPAPPEHPSIPCAPISVVSGAEPTPAPLEVRLDANSPDGVQK
jgi:hypothetical protein